MLFNQVIVSLCLYKEDRESYSLARVELKGIYSYNYDPSDEIIALGS